PPTINPQINLIGRFLGEPPISPCWLYSMAPVMRVQIIFKSRSGSSFLMDWITTHNEFFFRRASSILPLLVMNCELSLPLNLEEARSYLWERRIPERLLFGIRENIAGIRLRNILRKSRRLIERRASKRAAVQ